MDKPPIVILSRERATIGTTWKLFPNAIVAVNKHEEKDYRDAGVENELWLHDEYKSATVRNYILDRVRLGNPVILMDDDIKSVGRFYVNAHGKCRSSKMYSEEFYKKLCDGFILAEGNDYHLFGVAPTTNPLNFKPNGATKTNVFINGPLMCIRVTDKRFDPEMPVKCDYDFTVQHIAAGLGVFRLDRYWQDNDFDKMTGGRSCYKKDSDKAVSFHYLMEKWPGYFRENPRRQYEVIIRRQKKK